MARGLCRQVLSYRQDFQVPQACAVLTACSRGSYWRYRVCRFGELLQGLFIINQARAVPYI